MTKNCLHVFSKKFSVLVFSIMFVVVLASFVKLAKTAGFWLTYVITPSVPKGFYFIVPARKIDRYDIVEFVPPGRALKFIRDNHFGPENGHVLKYVFGMPGDYSCVKNGAIWINGKKIGKVYKFYKERKLLPQAGFCGKIRPNEYLLMSTIKERSFDGRYFGPVSVENILGKAVALKIF